ncbi:MAG: TIGR03013 family PEP-CTERM/XrtA system glycosyltransferase [Steroidobacteraceae bacterium]
MNFKFFGTHVHVPFLILAICESAALWVGATAAILLLKVDANLTDTWHGPATFAVLSLIAMFAMGMFSRRLRERTAGELLRLLFAVIAGVIATALLSRLVGNHVLPVYLYFVAAAMGFVLAALVRIALGRVINEDVFRRNVLVYGSGARAQSLAGLRRRADQRGFRLVGFVRPEGEPVSVEQHRLLTVSDTLLNLAYRHDIDEIVVAMEDRRKNFPVAQLLECRLAGVEITEVVTFFERETGKVRLDVLHPSWLIFSEGFRQDHVRRLSQRVFDLIFGCLFLVFLWPFMLLVALAIKVEDGPGAPVLYRQRRVGLLGKPFEVLKFRSMHTDAERDGAPRWASEGDSRITRVGAFIRKVRLDELPQILNVIRGDMSFVGPRPERPEFVSQLENTIPYYRERHWVKPGITGWAQLCYSYGSSERDAFEKLQYDLYYVKNHTLLFDLVILLQTVEVILMGKGAR